MQNSKNFQVYRSSAGSGKTFTLARKFLGLTLQSTDPNSFKHILAITFTVKAAHEMKARILGYLTGFVDDNAEQKDIPLMLSLVSEDTGLSKIELKARSQSTLNRILHHYGELSVLTIDKFVHGIIRSFSSDLGLNSDFEVEIDHARIVDRTIAQLFDQVGIDSELTKLVSNYVQYQTSRDKSWNITSALEELCYELNTESFYLNASQLETLDWSTIQSILDWTNAQVADCKNRIKTIGTKAIQESDKRGLSSSDFHHTGRGIFSYFEKARDPEFKKIIAPNSYVESTIHEDKWQSKTENEAVLDIAPIWTDYYHEIRAMDPLIRNCMIYEKLPSHLFRMGLIGKLQNIMQTIKEDDNQQLLSDFYKILSNNFSGETTPYIYERLGNRYNHVLIDEFQDTSHLQWQNLLPLVENSLAEGNQSLIVGDAKQSIYRFRGSEPSQFTHLPSVSSEARLLFESEYVGHTLDNNFRSFSNIVDFNNRFFKSLSSTLDQQHRETFKDLEQKGIHPKTGVVSLNLVKTEPGDDKLTAYFMEMSKELKGLIANNNYRQNEICFLFQKNSEAAAFSRLLLESGFGVQSEESLLLINNAKVLLLIDTLKCIDQPYNTFCLQHWLLMLDKCDLLKEDYHAIAKLNLLSKSSFHQVLKELRIDSNLNNTNRNHFDVLTHLCEVFHFDTKDVFIQKLLDFVLDFEQSSLRFKKSFIDHWTAESSRLSIESDPGSDAIQVMTIHKSKGLEFPVVFVHVPALKSNRLTNATRWVPNDFEIPSISQLLLPLTELKESSQEKLYLEEKEKSLLDSISQLYVAFTRAKEQLHIYTDQKPDKTNSTSAIPASSEFEFITKWPEWNPANKQILLN